MMKSSSLVSHLISLNLVFIKEKYVLVFLASLLVFFNLSCLSTSFCKIMKESVPVLVHRETAHTSMTSAFGP